MNSERTSRVLSRSWRSAVAVAVVGALVALAASFIAPQRYEATADVLLTPVADVSADDAVDARLLQSYALVLGGRTIAESVDADDADLEGSVVEGTSVLRATASSGDADRAAEISQGAAENLVALLVERGVAVESPAPDDAGDDEPPNSVVVAASVVESAAVPATPVSPSIPWWVAIGALVGALLGLLVSAVRQLTDRYVRTTDDLTEAASAPLLAAVAYDRQIDRSPLVTDLDPQDPRFEATRILRTNLQFLDVDSSDTVLTVTSCMSGDGKSTTAANLAIALAHGGEQVVLIDADLRRPRLAELFGLDGLDGLTTTLVGSVDPADAVQQTRVPGLDVLTTGKLPPNPSELLATNAMSDLVHVLRAEYDVVLFDAPPLLPVADAAVLATLSDGAVLLVRHGRTTREQVRAAVGRLEAVGAPLLGTVLTMVPARVIAPYGYGYGYKGSAPLPAPVELGRRARR
ncbi:polysaccharide biosynthesis tyrosine autokinase [Aeromicrobium sp. CF3.5]|uniref:polysaccharide biosynthesis tyrosine autokinase n=1 Tax=Aeromicrobium sp. CF3.5 TaxID=3373078 RepID=UPI003EE5666C